MASIAAAILIFCWTLPSEEDESIPVLNSHVVITSLSVPARSSAGHIYEFHAAKPVRIATVQVVGVTIGTAILKKYFIGEVPST